MAKDFRENCIEWFNGDELIACTLSSTKLMNKVRKLHDEFPEQFGYYKENKDSIYCKIPVSWLKLNHRRVSEEQAIKLKERMNLVRNR